MVPAGRHWAGLCDRRFVVGARYALAEQHERSLASHRQYFASLHEAWLQLPEAMTDDYPTSEHLRKKALIATGYRDERSLVCASKVEARRVAAFVRPADGYAVISTNGPVVVVWTAKSQSMRAMGKKAFQESKQAVLDYVWALVGVSPEEGAKNAGRAA